MAVRVVQRRVDLAEGILHPDQVPGLVVGLTRPAQQRVDEGGQAVGGVPQEGRDSGQRILHPLDLAVRVVSEGGAVPQGVRLSSPASLRVVGPRRPLRQGVDDRRHLPPCVTDPGRPLRQSVDRGAAVAAGVPHQRRPVRQGVEEHLHAVVAAVRERPALPSGCTLACNCVVRLDSVVYTKVVSRVSGSRRRPRRNPPRRFARTRSMGGRHNRGRAWAARMGPGWAAKGQEHSRSRHPRRNRSRSRHSRSPRNTPPAQPQAGAQAVGMPRGGTSRTVRGSVAMRAPPASPCLPQRRPRSLRRLQDVVHTGAGQGERHPVGYPSPG
jgi:hypothetical protein